MSARNGKPKHHKAGQSSQDDALSPERALEELSKACKRKDYDIQTIRSLVGALQSSFVKRSGGPHRNKTVEELESTESRLEIVRAQLEASKTQLYNINLQVDKQCQPALQDFEEGLSRSLRPPSPESVTQMRENLSHAASAFSESARTNMQLREDLNNALSEAKAAKAKRDKCRQSLQDVTKERDSIIAKSNDRFLSMREQIRELQEKCARGEGAPPGQAEGPGLDLLKTEVHALNERVLAAELREKKVISDAKGSEEDLESLRREHIALSLREEQLLAAQDENVVQLNAVQDRLSKAEKERDTQFDRAEEAVAARDKMESRIAELEFNNSNRIERIKECEQELQKYTSDHAEYLVNVVGPMRTELESLREEAKLQHDTGKALKSEMEQARKNSEVLRKSLHEQQDAASIVQSSYAELNARHTSLVEAHAKMEKNYERNLHEQYIAAEINALVQTREFHDANVGEKLTSFNKIFSSNKRVRVSGEANPRQTGV